MIDPLTVGISARAVTRLPVLAVDFNPTPQQPPGTEDATTIMNWVMWGGYAVAFIGLLLIAAMFAVAHNRGSGSQHAGSLGMWGFGVVLIGAAGAIVGTLSA